MKLTNFLNFVNESTHNYYIDVGIFDYTPYINGVVYMLDELDIIICVDREDDSPEDVSINKISGVYRFKDPEGIIKTLEQANAVGMISQIRPMLYNYIDDTYKDAYDKDNAELWELVTNEDEISNITQAIRDSFDNNIIIDIVDPSEPNEIVENEIDKYLQNEADADYDDDDLYEAFKIEDPFIQGKIKQAKELKERIKELSLELEQAENTMKTLDAELKPVFDSMKELSEKVAETEEHLIRIASYSYTRTDVKWKDVVEYSLANVDDAAKAIIAEGHALYQKRVSVKHSFSVVDKPKTERLTESINSFLSTLVKRFLSIFNKNIVKIEKANAQLEKLEYE